MTTAALRDRVRLIAPEFTGTADATIDAAAEWGALIVGAEAYAGAYLHNLALATAHHLTIAANMGTGATSGSGSSGGPVTSEQVGPVSRSYGSAVSAGAGGMPWSAALLAETSYGRLLLASQAALPDTAPWVV